MEKRITVALDAMGGDYAPMETVKGAVDAVKELDVNIKLVGPAEQLRTELAKYQYDKERIEIVQASEVIGTDESPTVIRAVAAGKVAAANIDAYLGFEHKIKTDVVVPPAHLTNAPPCGRVNLKSHCAPDCKGNFDLVVEGMSRKEADQESERCLRCDYFGFGSFRGGRTGEW